MASASFCNRTRSGIGSPHRQLSKQSRPHVHRQQARNPQQCHSYPLQHQRQRSERGSRLLKQLLCGLPYRLLQSCFGLPSRLLGFRSRMYPTPALRYLRPVLF
jgi:hypothetical protein